MFSDASKRNQFSDAIIFETLKSEASSEVPVCIFSKDKDFESAVQNTQNFKLADSWPALLALFDIDENAIEVKDLIESQESAVMDTIMDSLSTLAFVHADQAIVDVYKYVDSITSVPGTSMRRSDNIFASGKIIVELRLPGDFPLPDFVKGSRLGAPQDFIDSDEIELRFVVYVLALLNDNSGTSVKDDTTKNVLSGEILWEINGPKIGTQYHIRLLEWPKKEREAAV